jgi:CRP-like cAMP-binding protein
MLDTDPDPDTLAPPSGSDAARRPCRHDGPLTPGQRDALVSGSFLARLPPALVDAILARVRVWRLASGEPILRIGQEADFWLGIAGGSALVFMDLPHQPEMQCVNWVPTGVWVNLYNPLALRVSNVELRCEGPTTVAVVHACDLAALCQRFPELSREMAVANAGNFRRTQQVAIAAQRATLRQRQLFWLIEQTREIQAGREALKLSQEALAKWFGVSRQAWNDGIKALEQEGLVRRRQGEVTAVDFAALQAAMDAETRCVEAPYQTPPYASSPRPVAAGDAGPRALDALRTCELARVQRGRWYAALAPDLQQLILTLGRVRRLPAGEQLLWANERPDGCWLLVDGVIRLDNPHAPPPHRTMALLPAGTWYGHQDLIYASATVFDAVTQLPSTLLWLPASDFDTLFRERQDFRVALIRLLARAQSDAARYACSFNWSVEMRVGAWVQVMHRYFDLTSGPGPAIAASFVLEDIAQWLGTTRQAVSRQLKALQAQGVIRRLADRFEVLEPDRLPKLL